MERKLNDPNDSKVDDFVKQFVSRFLSPLHAKLKTQNHRETQYTLFLCCNQQIVMMEDHGFSVEMEIDARLDFRSG